ncbi:MAG: hypothetical protein H0U95_01325 [Bacteroidetes bacterium]|nr:hypothetical protein [Bacteroidota bacterium]
MIICIIMYSNAGKKEFRELAYIIPDLSMKLGLVLFAIHVGLLIIAYFIRRKNKIQNLNKS